MRLINTIARKIGLAIIAVFLPAPFFSFFAQVAAPQPISKTQSPVRVETEKLKVKVKTNTKISIGDDDDFTEKSIKVDPKVNISLCVEVGNLKISGWDRNEIRAFVSGGKIGFNVREKNKDDKAVLLIVNGFDAENKTVGARECLSGEDIELDVPRGATVNVKGQTSETTISAVRKTYVKILGGDITLNDIEQGINASTYEGDLTVTNSGGAITLETTNGNIAAVDIAPLEIGDLFRARTNSGAIALQQIKHRQNEITSNSGSIKFVGGLRSGGQYDFRTQNGVILLAVPDKSSFKINATYGFGQFNSEIPLQNIQKNPSPNSRTRSLSALSGEGDAAVNLTTVSGAIRLKKE